MTSTTSPRTRIHANRAMFSGPHERPLRALGAVNAMAAGVAEDAGFDALWVSGLEVSAAAGLPDSGVLGPRDLADIVAALSRVSALPAIVDIDNGGGARGSALRFAQDLMRAGAAAVCLEDSAHPKCNSFSAHREQGLAERYLTCSQLTVMRRAVGDDMALIARTEALIAGAGLDEALERALAYADCGADAVLIHSKDTTGAEALAVAKRWSGAVPLVCVPTAFPQLDEGKLGDAGFAVVIYANQLSRAALAGMRSATESFRVTGNFGPGLAEVGDLMRVGDPGAESLI